MVEPPKTKGRQYIPLNLVIKENKLTINKCLVEIKDDKLYTDNREVESFVLDKDNFVIIKAQHFTSKQGVNDIRTYRRFLPVSEEDDYVYFIENGFYNITQEEIKHISGARSAEVKFEVMFNVKTDFVWIKFEKNHPIKFAVEKGINSDEIIGRLFVEKINQ